MFLFNLFSINSLILLTFILGIYFYLVRNFKYWTSRGINGPKPVVFLGTFWQNLLDSIDQVALNNSNKYGKVYGAFMGSRPTLTIADPNLIKDISIKDFHAFTDRMDYEFVDGMEDRALPNLRGEEWKKMRSIISPTFTTGKLRKMHPIIVDCIKRLENSLEKKVLTQNNNEFELTETFNDLTMDVISTCAFGTQIDIYGESKSEFLINAEKFFHQSWRIWTVFLLLNSFPKLIKWFGFHRIDPKVISFFRNGIRTIASQRNLGKQKPNDYLQLIINAQNKTLDFEEQNIEDDDKEDIFGQINQIQYPKLRAKVEVTEDDVLANSFIFFVAGFEPIATLLSTFFYSMATHQKCQQRLYEELKPFEGQFNYETISKMPYLDACVAETLRLYTTSTFNSRITTEEYKLGDTGITIEKGTYIDLDVQSLHHSPEYYPNPERWDPQRFLPENRHKLIPYTYMPFGIGPRNCIGMRFVLIEVKTAIAYLLYKFKFLRTANTQIPLIPKKFGVVLNFDEIKIGIESRK